MNKAGRVFVRRYLILSQKRIEEFNHLTGYIIINCVN